MDDAKLRASTDWAFVNMLAEREESGGADTISQMLLGRDRGSPWRKKPPRHFKTVDPYETLFEVLLERQNHDGSWPPEGQLSTPPEITTGWALLALHSRRDMSGDPSEHLDFHKDLGDELAKQLATLERQIPESRVRALNYLKETRASRNKRRTRAANAARTDLRRRRERFTSKEVDRGAESGRRMEQPFRRFRERRLCDGANAVRPVSDQWSGWPGRDRSGSSFSCPIATG